ncbi:MAG: type I 3-dehydroquinate dehydratase, partial [Anaerolineae bacterium]
MAGLQVCVSMAGRMPDVLSGVRRAAADGADLVEMRLDLIPDYDLAALLGECPLPAIVTHRPEREGGAYRGSEDERLAVLRHAIALGAAYVDVEADSVQALGERGGSKLIVSHHDLAGTAHPLHRLYADLAGLGADVVKVAVTANDIADNLDVFEVLR